MDSRRTTIYGPVNSRRFGYGIGINLGNTDISICTWRCLYCQCGRGKKIFKRSDFPSSDKVIQEIRNAIMKFPNIKTIDIAGNSEPTIHPDFLKIVKNIISLREETMSSWDINCLSNGSELDNSLVIEACNLINTWIKFDCAIYELFVKFNQPILRCASVENQIQRIKKLSSPKIQTMLWQGEYDISMGNIQKENLDALIESYLLIKPTHVHLTTLEINTPNSNLKAVNKNILLDFATQIGSIGIARSFYPGRV